MENTMCGDAMKTDVAAAEADAAFAHLQELVDLLPEMQELGDKLKRAREAQKIGELKHDVDTVDLMLSIEKEGYEAAAAAFQEAQTAGDAEKIEHQQREMIYYYNECELRKGPSIGAHMKLDDALAASCFASVEEALAAVLPQDEFDALAARIDAYRDDYTQTLALCQSLDDGSEE